MQTQTIENELLERETVTFTPNAALFNTPGESAKALTIAQAYVIDCDDMAQAAADERRELARKIDWLKKQREEFLEPGKAIVAKANAFFNPLIQTYEQARTLIGDRLRDFELDKRKRLEAEKAAREAEERRRRQQAEQEAAAARAKAEAEAAEALRKQQEAAERQRKAEAEGNARAAAKAAQEAARAGEKANAALETGAAKARELELAVAAPAAAPPAETKTKGSSLADNWQPVLKDGLTEDDALLAIVKAYAEHPQVLAFLSLNMKGIRKAAGFGKHAFIPGFDVKNQPIIRGARK